jgi:ABC-2 type transport system permease protein
MGDLVGQVRNATGSARGYTTRLGGSDLILNAYRASILQMAAMAVAIYAVQVLLRMRTEEADGPLEPILATATSRPLWVASHAINALIGVAVLLVMFAAGAG